MAAKPDQSDPFSSTAAKQASAEVSRMGEAQAGAMLAMQQELLGRTIRSAAPGWNV